MLKRICCLVSVAVAAMTNLSAQSIARVDSEHTEMVVHSLAKSTFKFERTITVLNSQGDDYASITIRLDKGEKLSSFAGNVCNSAGKEIKKLRKSDLAYTEVSSALAEDGATYLFQYRPLSYPVTLTYSYTIDGTAGVPFLSPFMPQNGERLEVVNATYRLTIPKEVGECHHYLHNIEGDPVKVSNNENGSVTYEVRMDNLPAIAHEPLAVDFRERVPYVEFVPARFVFDGYEGRLSTWNDYAEWQSGLLRSRSELPQALRNEIRSMTAGLTTQKQKLAALYEYLGRHTRYVSIQLGIGGFRPMTAADVYSKGYGDCKALTNFMQAILREVGIDSYYTVVNTKCRRMNGYSSFGFFDHVILKAVCDGENVWVECTAPEIPLGYIHDNIAGHDVLVINDGKAIVETIPEYSPEDSRFVKKCHVEVVADGTAQLQASFVCSGGMYEPFIGSSEMTKEELRKELSDFFLPLSISLNDAKTENFDEPFKQPRYEMYADYVSQYYSKKTGTRLFLSLTPFANLSKNKEKVERRESKFELLNRMVEIDSVDITFPKGYKIESCPKEANIESKFGTCSLTLEHRDGGLCAVIRRRYEGGVYEPSEYDAFRSFMSSILGIVSSRIVLIPE